MTLSEQLSFAELAAEPTDGLFLAAFVPEVATQRIVGLQKRLAVTHRLWGKPIQPDRLHITLCHLGDYAGLPGDLVSKAKSAGAAVSMPSFKVWFDTVGSFSGRARNKPLVMQGGRGAEGVVRLQQALHVELTKAGLGRWAKPYTPYVTLLYDNVQVPEQQLDAISWIVDEFVLVHSLLGKTQHKRLQTWKLDARGS